MGSKARGCRLTPLAEADLEEIWLYTFRRWSPEQADAYVRGIMAAIAGLARGDKVGLRTDVRPGYRKYRAGMHVIYFRRSGEFVDVIRILHERMDVERHLDGDGE
ncbi:MAG: type II toxin-antitoxin system RelE/ParE family toxin [Desulfovibrio desulfuricans]|jgi:toxin ParE1/3/4|nr:type II toxin-antitoxin system RelE/ParE family toxin [Desulfovibrio desulfuricans]